MEKYVVNNIAQYAESFYKVLSKLLLLATSIIISIKCKRKTEKLLWCERKYTQERVCKISVPERRLVNDQGHWMCEPKVHTVSMSDI